MEWNGMEWNGMEWNGMEWKTHEQHKTHSHPHPHPLHKPGKIIPDSTTECHFHTGVTGRHRQGMSPGKIIPGHEGVWEA